MASPYNYAVSSFIISNIDNHNSDDEDDNYEEESNFNDLEEDTSEFSVPTDMDTSTIDSDNEDHVPRVSTSGDGDSVVFDNLHEIDGSGNSTHTDSDNDLDEEQVEHKAKRIKLDKEGEQSVRNESTDLHQTCPICLASWTNVGEHRLCSLRCGHLFGYKCIKQWLNSDNESAKKCPQCNAKASKKHIRFIYACKLTCQDVSEIERMKKEIKEVRLRELEAKKALIKEKKRAKKYKQMYKAQTLAMTADSDFCFSD